MKVAILGGSGFIGKYLTKHLLDEGYKVEIWTRAPEEYTYTDQVQVEKWPLDLSRKHLDIDVIVNLAGETINQKWTPEAKEGILQSRVDTTYHIYQLISNGYLAPKVIINGSAVGYYGTSAHRKFTESDPPQNDFLAQVTAAWERAADQLSSLQIRLVKLRLGLVLGDGGALPKMLLPYKLYVGGRLGAGTQWVSWIHIQDVARMVQYVIEHEEVSGVYNAVAPEPVRMNDFGKTIGKVLHRPHWFPAPAFGLKALLGEMSMLILQGQYVIPKRIQEAGFSFEYPSLEAALTNILQENVPKT